MKPIRLAILGTQGIPAKYGGYETFAEELSTRLVSMGDFEVTVYCPWNSGGENPPSSYKGVALRYVKSPGRGGLANILFDVWCLFACLGRHDVVYLCGYGASYLAWLPRIFGAKVWINIGGLEWKRSKWHPLIRRYVKICEWFCGQCATHVICDAQAILDYFQKAYRSRAAGVEPLEYLVLVSRLEPENNVLEIIQGYNMHPTSMPLVVVGNLDERPYVQLLRKTADRRVVFVGGVYDKPRLAALRRYAFATFHGHSVGGTNPSLLEALAAGRPIIAHDNPFNREVGGPLLQFFKSPRDIPPVLRALEQRASSSDLDQLPAAERWLQERYSWESVARDYAALLRQEAPRSAA